MANTAHWIAGSTQVGLLGAGERQFPKGGVQADNKILCVCCSCQGQSRDCPALHRQHAPRPPVVPPCFPAGVGGGRALSLGHLTGVQLVRWVVGPSAHGGADFWSDSSSASWCLDVKLFLELAGAMETCQRWEHLAGPESTCDWDSSDWC